MAASPLGMGTFTTAGPPQWVSKLYGNEVCAAARQASEWCIANGTTIEQVAGAFGLKEVRFRSSETLVPTVIGCKNVAEVKWTVETWRKVNLEPEEPIVAEWIAAVRKIFKRFQIDYHEQGINERFRGGCRCR